MNAQDSMNQTKVAKETKSNLLRNAMPSGGTAPILKKRLQKSLTYRSNLPRSRQPERFQIVY